MPGKQLTFGDESRDKILKGVNQLADAVAITLGPRGRNVVLERKFGAPTVTKDGVSVAREVELKDPFENMGAQLVREVASKTSDVAGDGTTTATVIARAIFKEGLRSITAGANAVEVKRGIDKAVEKATEEMKKQSTPITEKRQISEVATIASINEKEFVDIFGFAMLQVILIV
ncbi:MAG: chaperonin GroEL, partial [Deltaproteobacteria bacterium]|nr:chaperonin GroEL [Deltaproteobacteria bacterium]